MEIVQLTVLQDDIDQGKRRDGRECAVALAAKRELGASHVLVTRGWVMADGRRYVVPGGLLLFVDRFDEGFPVEPAKFELAALEAGGGCLPRRRTRV